MSKVLVSVNVLDNVNAQVYGSHCQEWFRMGRRNTEDEFILFHPNRLSIDNARNQAAYYALLYECDYIYFVDDDMILTPNTYDSLKNCEADIAQALTFVRSYPFHMMAFKKDKPGHLKFYDDYKEFVQSDGILKCEAVGFACVLIKVELLKKINAPFFVTGAGTTEDVYFCIKLRQKLGENVKIVVDTRVPTSHLLYPQALNASNREQLLDQFKPETEPGADRGKEYLEQCKVNFSIQSPINQ